MRQCWRAIIVISGLFTVFLKFKSIDAGCTESRFAAEKPNEKPNRAEWHIYCEKQKLAGSETCNKHTKQPCISSVDENNNRVCKPADFRNAPKHDETWKAFCNQIEKIDQFVKECNGKTIQPCFWHKLSKFEDNKQKCVAKGSTRIFVLPENGREPENAASAENPAPISSRKPSYTFITKKVFILMRFPFFVHFLAH